MPWGPLALLAVVSGCATNLSTMQTARTLKPGQIRVGGGVGAFVPAGQTVGLFSQGIALGTRAAEAAARQEPFVLTEEEQRQLVTGAIAVATMPPAPGFEISARVGVIQNLDLGLRYGQSSLRFDAKYRLFHRGQFAEEDWDSKPDHSFDLAVGVGVSKYFFKHPLIDLLDMVKLGDFDRWDVEVPIYASYELNEHFGVYGAAKYVLGRTELDGELVQLSEACRCAPVDLRLPKVVHTHFVGGTVGLRAGFERISLFAELTIGNTFASTVVLGERRELGGLTLYPSVGLAATFR